MMRTTWLSTAARRGLLPSLRIRQFSAPLCRVQFCANVKFGDDAKFGDAVGLVDAAKLVAKEYAELELDSIENQVGLGVRVRQHVNPFKASLTAPMVPPAWETEFADPTLPLHVDIGCGSGRLLLVLAKRRMGSSNFLGIDIRDKLLQRSRIWAEELNLTNIHFMVSNATLALNAILLKYPGPVKLVTILCPDPHFKKRHQKRRIVQKSLVDALEKHLPTGGQIFLQSDVEEVAKDMRDQFDENVNFSRVHPPGSNMCDSEGWLLENHLGVATEREIHAVANGGSIFRMLFQRV
ncbi:uncharacterized protein [Physcomitrium patens]|uniref:uncharacterized protein isoform X2 n=1 Tax=Physcomitrium patens TaxID=3218 RepID=UPI000D156821|nr:uncharacterized protein LOC112295194 isoform X2 [Physcomitrium patens]|eukprot:XP_024402237.1 uncharacterized protein LOC112295194 isoform X2 [Physcomitrella patens]